MLDLPILSLLLWLPILGGLVVLAAGNRLDPRQVALGITLLTFLISLLMLIGFNLETAQMQFQEQTVWISSFKINYHLGVDGFSVPLIILNSFITILVVIAAWEVIRYRINQYLAAFLIMEGIVNGVFAALDAMLFYILFEGMLIPLFLIIGIWGGPQRVYATLKFFLYTFFGSVFLLISLVYLYQLGNSFAIADMQKLPLAMLPQTLIFLSFLLAFGIKVPMWPVHTWLPDAHVEAPTGGSVILAAITLKVGGYAFIRFALPIVPDAAAHLSSLVIFMSLTAIVYIGFVALVQQDMKKLIAYSSIAHMGFVTLALFIIYLLKPDDSRSAALALQGGMIQMISHGFISGALFLCIGVLYDRMHTRDIKAYGGVVNTMPYFATFFVLFAMANTGLPGTSGFVGELFVILASFKANFWIASLAASTLIIGSSYTLWLVKRVIFGAIQHPKIAQLRDLNQREFGLLAVLAVAVLLLGVWPAPLNHLMNVSIEQLLAHALQSKCGGNVLGECP